MVVSLSGGVDSGTIIGMLHKLTGQRVDAVSLSYNEKTEIDNLSKYSKKLSYSIIIEILSILNEAELNFQKSLNPNLLIELTFLKITTLEYSDEEKK